MIRKIIITLLLCLCTISTIVCASSANMNLTNRNQVSQNTNSMENSINNEITNSVSNTEMETNITSVNNINDVSSSSIGINQILNIFLIAVGLILILLAIAILIRLKN